MNSRNTSQLASDSFGFEYGTLSYLKDGQERGREPFWLTSNRDGTRTLRSLAMTDDSQFVRDATYTLGTDLRMRDAFVRLQVGAQLVGTGSFCLQDDQLTARVEMNDFGHLEQRLTVGPRFHLITHAVMLDGWSPWPYDEAKGGRQAIPIYNTSTQWNGTDGPLGRMEEILLERQADEELTVPAGTYECRRYTIDSDVLDVPTSHIWVGGPNNVLVRYSWPGQGFDYEYLLSEHGGQRSC